MIHDNPTLHPLKTTRGFLYHSPTHQFREGYINRKIGKIWRRWENKKLRLIQLIDLQLHYFKFNPTSTYAKCVSNRVSRDKG